MYRSGMMEGQNETKDEGRRTGGSEIDRSSSAGQGEAGDNGGNAGKDEEEDHPNLRRRWTWTELQR